MNDILSMSIAALVQRMITDGGITIKIEGTTETDVMWGVDLASMVINKMKAINLQCDMMAPFADDTGITRVDVVYMDVDALMRNIELADSEVN